MTKARNIADLLDANGDVKSASLDNVPASNDASALTTGTIDNARISLDANEIPNLDTAKITSGTFADARISNQNKVVKSGSAPSSPQEGDLWYDTTNDILKVYDTTSNSFVKVVTVTPTLISISGSIITATTGNLTLNGSGFMTANLIVSFTPSGGSASTVTVTPTSDTVATVAIPSAIYGQSASTVIGIKVTNEDNKSSSTVNETVIDLPSGGTISTHGSYTVHTFLSTANLVIPSNFSRSMETLIVAGGGAGGNWHAGGGGAGGMITYNITPSAGTYTMTVGAGGAGGTTSVGSQGGGSVAFSQSTVGGGRGGNYNNGTLAGNGGSGAGGNGQGGQHTKGTGTAGQGSDGGDGWSGGSHAGGGGGGKGAVGGTGLNKVKVEMAVAEQVMEVMVQLTQAVVEVVLGTIHLQAEQAEQAVEVMVLTMEIQAHQQQVQIILAVVAVALVHKEMLQVTHHKLQVVVE